MNVLASSALGKMLDARKNRGIPMPYLRNINVRWGSFDLSDLLKMRFEPSENERYGLEAGDLVVCEGGEPGRCAVWMEERHDMKIQKALHRIRPHKNVSSHFLFYVFQQYAMSHYMDSFFTGSTIKHLTGEAVSHLLVPLPPCPEQKRIVAQIESLLKCVDEIDRESATLEKSITLAKQKILDLAIRGKLVPQNPADEPASELLKKIKAEKEALIKAGKLKRDKHESFIFRGDDNCYHENIDGKTADITEEIPFDLPQGWVWCRLISLCSLITDGTHQTPEYSESGYVFLSSTNVTSGKIDWSNVKYIPEQLHRELYERLSPQFGDILLAKNGTIGCAAIVDRHDIFDIYVSLALLRPFRFAISEKFLYRIIGAPAIQKFFAGEKKGIGLFNLHLENIRQTPIPLPPHAEQKRIVSQVENLFSIIETMR